MKIQDLFEKPIDRAINGVIKAEQLDDETVWQELDEFVVTKELDIHFRKFIDTYLVAIDTPDDPSIGSKVGVWVSGFFGSGKSHFIKILSYLLENRKITKDGITKNAVDFFEEKITDPMLVGDIKRAVQEDVDVILFNIGTKGDNSDGRDVVLKVFLNVFNERLGYSSDHPHIAHMERYLVKKGLYEKFQDIFLRETGEQWKKERDAYSFYSDALAVALSEVLEQKITDIDAFFERFEKDFRLTVENFAKWVQEYLESKSKNHKIIFLVDEMGQFIGQDTPLMLNLQTITENLGTVCNGRAWVIVTSQEDIDAVLGELRSSAANDFSKIQGRFKTRLSLSGANADEVIQKRLLGKVDDAQTELAKLYSEKCDILNNQLSFKDIGMSYKSYEGESDFITIYPFAPYQFPLVQKIFESTRKSGASGAHLAKGERSMLDAFQTAACDIAKEDVGVLVPLYRFYPAIENFLEGMVRRAVNSAEERPSLQPFDGLLLRTLYLIRYVEEMPGNVDNLVTLFIDRIDADRLDLRNKLEASLQRLEKETLVSRNGEVYFFLTNEERDISRDIKAVDSSPTEEAKLMGQLVFEDVLKEEKKYRFPVNKKDFTITRLCDQHPYGTKTDGSLILSVITPLSDDHELCGEAKCIGQSTVDGGQVVIRLDDHKLLAAEIRIYIQTEKYVYRKNDGTVPATTKKILIERASENSQRKLRLASIVEQLMAEAKYYVAGHLFNLPTGSLSKGVDEALHYLVENSFNKLGLLKHTTDNPQAEIRAVLSAPPEEGLGLEGDFANPDSLNEVSSYVSLMVSKNHKVVLYDLVMDRFGRRPFGWPEWETVLLVVRLVMSGAVSLSKDGGTLDPNAIYPAIDGPNKWRHITVLKRQSVDKTSLQKTRNAAKEIFQGIAPDGEDALMAHLRSNLEGWRDKLKGWKPLAETGTYPGASEIADGLGLIAKALHIKSSFEFIGHFEEFREDFLDLSETIDELDNFYTAQKPAWDRLHRAKQRFDQNRQQLERDEEAATSLKRIGEILLAPAPYGLIREADSLIETVSAVNDRLVNTQRSQAASRIEEHIARVKDELEAAGASPDLSNACLTPLQSLKKQLGSQGSIAHILQIKGTALVEQDEAFARIEQAGKKAFEAQAQVQPDQTGLKETTIAAPVITAPVKKRRIVQPAKLVSGHYLETNEEVYDFLETLQKELLEAIENKEKIEIR